MKTDYAKILSLFVTHEQSRFDLGEPFYWEDLATATNGHAAAVVDASLVSFPPNDKDKKVPNVKAIIPTDIPEGIEIELAKLRSEALAKDIGKQSDCPQCEGEGGHYCSCGDYHNCAECDGDGVIGPPKPNARLNGKPFNYEYINTIRRAAEMTGAATVRYSDCGKGKVSVFDFDKVRCVLMPLNERKLNVAEIPELL